MKNAWFGRLLSEPKGADGKVIWTIGRVAQAIYSNRSHVNDVLNNAPGHGGRTRPKLVRFFKENFTYWSDMLATLGWTESGDLFQSTFLNSATDDQDVTQKIPRGTRPAKCKCGLPARNGQSTCNFCHAEGMRIWRKRKKDAVSHVAREVICTRCQKQPEPADPQDRNCQPHSQQPRWVTQVQ